MDRDNNYEYTYTYISLLIMIRSIFPRQTIVVSPKSKKKKNLLNDKRKHNTEENKTCKKFQSFLYYARINDGYADAKLNKPIRWKSRSLTLLYLLFLPRCLIFFRSCINSRNIYQFTIRGNQFRSERHIFLRKVS